MKKQITIIIKVNKDEQTEDKKIIDKLRKWLDYNFLKGSTLEVYIKEGGNE